MYESQISFTLDTICPWTFIAKKRLDQALAQFRSSDSNSDISFTLHFEPYQLNSELSKSTDRAEWYLENRHFSSTDAQATFQKHMANFAEPLGIKLRFDGLLGNTLQAHRIIQYFQDKKGTETANRLVDALYDKYFAQGKHPASDETLLESCVEAGIDEKEAREVIFEDRERGEKEVKARLRVVSMDTDAVPVVAIEGKRRDITLTGAKEVEAYIKALETVAKESI